MSFPILEASVTGRNTVASTSHSITLPAGIVQGELLLVVFAVDPSPNSRVDMNVGSGSGWKKMTWAWDGNVLCSAVFWKFADASNSFTVSTNTAEQSVHASFRISGAKSFSYSVTINAYPPNPLSTQTGMGDEFLNLLVNVNEGNISGITQPTGYTLITSNSSPNATTGASLAIASKQSYGLGVENPNTWAYTFGGGGGINSWHFSFSELDFEGSTPSVIAKKETILSAATTHSIRMPDAIIPGNLIFVHFSTDLDTSISINTSISGNGWNIISSSSQPSTGPASISVYKVATGSDVLTFTTGLSTLSKAISYHICNASHIIGNTVSREAGGPVDWDDADSYESAIWNENTASGFGGTWNQPILISTILSYKLENSPFYSAANGTMVYDAENITIATTEYSSLTANVNRFSFTQFLASTTDPFNISVFTIFPKYYRQIRLVGGETVERIGGTTPATLQFASSTFLDKISSTSSGVGVPVRSFNEDGVLPDDLIVAISAVGTIPSRNPSIGIPGYTTLSETISTGSTYRTKLWIGYKFMTSPVDTSITFPGSGNIGDAHVGSYMILRNINKNDPFDQLSEGFEMVQRSGTGIGRPTDYTRGTYRGVANTRTGLKMRIPGNSYLRIAASAGSGALFLDPPNDNFWYFAGDAFDTNSVNATISFIAPSSSIDGWALDSPSLNLSDTWVGGTTGTGDSWIEVLVPLNVQPRPINGAVIKTYNADVKNPRWVTSDFMLYNEDTAWEPKPIRIWDGNKWVTYTTNQYI